MSVQLSIWQSRKDLTVKILTNRDMVIPKLQYLILLIFAIFWSLAKFQFGIFASIYFIT